MHLQWMFSRYFKPLSVSYIVPKFAFAVLFGLMSKWNFEFWYTFRQCHAKVSFIIEQSSVYLRNKAFSLFFSVLECFVEIQHWDQSTLYFRYMYQMHFPERPSENLWEMFALVTQSNCFINFKRPLSWSHCFPLISHINNILEFLCCCFDLWSASRLLHVWPFFYV